MGSLEWRLLSSNYLIRDRFLTLRSDTYRLPDGQVASPFYVLEYPPWVNVVAITPEHQILLVRQYRPGLGRVLLELPAGAVEPGDATVLDAAKRELLEETGFSSDSISHTGTACADPANHNNLTFSFLARNAQRVSEPQPHAAEHLEVLLMPVDEVVSRAGTEDFLQALHVSSLLFAVRALGLSHFVV
jgi:ADP-ribose pyrophosphatase